MINYSQGDILLLRGFPQTDLKKEIKRSVLVLTDLGDKDVTVARVTSEIYHSPYDYRLKNWKEVGLLLPSVIRLGKLATLHKEFVVRKLGSLSQENLLEVKEIIIKMFKLI